MEAIELIAIIILIVAIALLIYYYVQTSNGNSVDFKKYFQNIPPNVEDEYSKPPVSGEEKVEEKKSMSDRIKITIKDIDENYINTDAFSKRLDGFLDEKSEELIVNWSLVTQDDLGTLEQRSIQACENIDALEKRFSEYSNSTDEKIADLDARLKVIEEETKDLEE